MSEISTINENIPTAISKADAFAAAASDLCGSALPIIKLTKDGNWVRGAENTPVTEIRFAVDVDGAERGFVCFVDGKLEDKVMVRVASGKKVSQETLPDHGPYEGNDGWKACTSIQLRSLTSGDEFLFCPVSNGGLAAIGPILKMYKCRLQANKGGIPIIDLDVADYKHKSYGKVLKPVLKIVEWRNEEDLGGELLDDSQPF